MIRGRGPRRFRMEEPGPEPRRVHLPRPRPPELSGLVIGVGGFLLGALLSGSIWGGLAGGGIALLIWGGWRVQLG